MKNLILLRHAKSSWDDPRLPDFDRPLSKKGINDCAVVETELQKLNIKLQEVLCSSALRTRTTASLIFAENEIKLLPELYLCTTETIFNSIFSLKEKKENVALVFHNFSITDFVNDISVKSIDNIKTAGLVHVKIDGKWKDIVDKSKTSVQYFDRKKWEVLS